MVKGYLKARFMNTEQIQAQAKAKRLTMVETQLRPCDISDPLLLKAFATVPRELYLPDNCQGTAYADNVVELGEGRFLLSPLLLAKLIQALKINHCDRVLDIGCGFGYSSVILGYMAKQVVGVENSTILVEKGRQTLEDNGIEGVEIVCGPLSEGCVHKGPYDSILLQGAVKELPKSIVDQLADQGRIVAIIQQEDTFLGQVTLFHRQGEHLTEKALFNAYVPPLIASDPTGVFHFGALR